jgi:hypothetical protein
MGVKKTRDTLFVISSFSSQHHADQIFGTPIHHKKPVNIELTPIDETFENKFNCWNAKSCDSRLVYYVLNLVPNSLAIFIMFSFVPKGSL